MEIFLAGGSIIGDHHIQRGALFVEMGTIRVCCTHLDHISENERAIQAGGLVRQLHDLRGDSKAMLLAGDLNALNDEAKWDRLDAIHEENGWAPPEDSTVPGGALHTFLENGWVDASRGAGLSSPAKDPVRRVDYVLAHGPVVVKRARTDASADGSDHLPIVVEVEVPA
jgi:endonuclease/exonuclease/phosphatase family metal-dependent hydrolase